MTNACRRSTAALMAWLVVSLGTVAAEPAGPVRAKASNTPTVHRPAPPLAFEENRGQADAHVRYLSRARDYAIALTGSDALLAFRQPAEATATDASGVAIVRMRLVGASSSPTITPRDLLPGKVYYAGPSATGRLTPIDTFRRIEYGGVYPGVDLVYRGDDRRLEFDFVVAPFADPAPIALTLEGADHLRITETGDLSARVHRADLLLKAPVVYQERGEQRVGIEGGYVIASDGRSVRFQLGAYDPSLPLVIDPTWLTQFGSASEDWTAGLEVDSAGDPHLLGLTLDPATFSASDRIAGALQPPNCYLAKFDGATGLSTYSIMFADTGSCGSLAISPNDVVYFAGYVSPNGVVNDAGTTVTAVDDSSGVPTIRRFAVTNYDSRATGGGVTALAVNAAEHVFLLGPCRLAQAGEPPLLLAGFNDAVDPPHGVYAEGCTVPGTGLLPWHQPLLTVVDATGSFLYGSLLSPGETISRYAIAADDADRAFIVGAESTVVAPTPDAFRGACPAAGSRGFDLCSYLMVLDTASPDATSLLYASYLWNTDSAQTLALRLSADGHVYVGAEGQIFDDFPSNRPTDASAWPFSLYPALSGGIQVARFAPDANGQPSQLDFALVFDPSRAVAALAGQTVRDAFADLRLFPSGALAVASTAYSTVAAPLGIITTFHPDANRVGEGWTQTLATRDPAPFAIAPDRDGNLFLAGQLDRTNGPDADVFVERLDSADPLGNHAPSVQILFPPAVLYATDPSGGSLAVTANAFDADGDSLTYTWTGPFIDLPVTTEQSLVARLAVGLQQTITVTVDDGRGGSASASFVVDVVGTPFAGTTAVPIDSACGTGFLCSYAPVTITAAAAPPIGSQVFLRTRVDQNPPVPVDLQAGSPPVYFDVSTNAPALVSPIDVCIDTRGMSFPTPAAIRMYHNAGQGWTDVTQSATGGRICGRTDTLGTFAIFYPQVPVTAIRTIAGSGTLSLNATDFVAGPATSTPLNYLFGGALDRARNLLYISEAAGFIDRVDLNSETISRVAGNGIFFPGSLTDPNDLRDDVIDGGDPFATFVGSPYEMAVDAAGNVVFFDRQTCMIRRLDVARNRIFNVAGTGTCGYSGDGGPAASAPVSYGPMAFDAAGNLFLSDGSYARVRRIDAATGIITTVAGNGSFGTPVNGAPALSTIGSPQGIAFDAQGQMILVAGDDLLRIAPGADNLIRGDADETIAILGGCHTNCVQPFGGDGLAASDPQLFLGYVPSLTVAADGAVILADRFRIRRIAPGEDGVVTGASDEVIQTIGGYYDPAANSITNFNGDTFATQSHLAFESVVFEDSQGRVIVVDGNNYRVRRFGFVGGGGPVGPAADLAVSIVQPTNGANVDLGAATNVDVLVSNLGPSTATPVRLRLPIPSGLAFVSGTIPDGVCDGSFGVLVCDMNQLGAGSSVHAALVFRPTATGQVTATFNVSTVTNDPVAANNSATLTLTVVPVPAIVDIVEQVIVTDAPAMLPAVTIGIVEGVAVTDQPAPLPSAMVGIVEYVAVGDAVQATGPGLPPVLSLPSAIVTEATGRLGTLVNFIASAVDDVDGPVPVTCTPASGSSFPIGVTVVTCSAADNAGNSSSGTFSVTVADTTPPSIFVPSNITVDAATSAGSTVSYFTFATDIVDGFTAAPCTPASGSVFPVGTTTVTCTATDTHGNSASRTFTVTVRPFIGTPQLSFRLAGVRRVGRVVTVTLAISNTGNGKATSITIRQLTARVLAGHGSVKEPKVPIAVGDLDAGTSKTVTLVLSPTAPRVVGFSLVEVGTYRNANSTASFTFSASQSINPIP